MLPAIVIGIFVVAALLAFLVPLRIAMRSDGAWSADARPARPASEATAFDGPDRLVVGAELLYDKQRWDVVGVQRSASADGPAWTAWHLDDRGQSGLLLAADGETEVLMAVRAEKPETLDPGAPVLRWRDHEWVRTARATVSVRAEGERRATRPAGAGLHPITSVAVERAVFVREELPTRRLLLERSTGEATWNAWIGSAVPDHAVDVWPPTPDGGTTST